MENKDLSIGTLLEFYAPLLTDKQADALDLYYNQDLSLAEIAEHMQITRQGVRDNIKRGEKQLVDYEKKLNLFDKFSQITAMCSIIKESAVKAKDISERAAIIAEEIIYAAENIESIL